jgi:hypothetical protein
MVEKRKSEKSLTSSSFGYFYSVMLLNDAK